MLQHCKSCKNFIGTEIPIIAIVSIGKGSVFKINNETIQDVKVTRIKSSFIGVLRIYIHTIFFVVSGGFLGNGFTTL